MSPRTRLSDARRNQILEAAVEMIGERGLWDTRVADIAERAGTSSALILYYFATKDRLLAEALAFAEERFYTNTAEELKRLASARDQLIRLIELSCSLGTIEGTWLDEWILWPDMWARSLRDPEVARDREAMDRRWRETIIGIVKSGQRAGEFARVDPADFALRLAALIDGLAIQVILDDPEVPAERMRDLCLAQAERELGFKAPRRLRLSETGRPRRRTGTTRKPDRRTAAKVAARLR